MYLFLIPENRIWYKSLFRSSGIQQDSIATLVEHRTSNPENQGSNPEDASVLWSLQVGIKYIFQDSVCINTHCGGPCCIDHGLSTRWHMSPAFE